ncbi:MAG: sodium-translocating pyrophosphatase [Patescibacteria group bacterium]|nr:sodium-translocating pyrophosphatase [Patescibacteria group bacterium]
MFWQILIFTTGTISILFAFLLYRWVIKKECGNPKMRVFSQAIQEGAQTYLKQLYKSLSLLALAIALILYFTLGWETAIAYLFGSFFSALSGYLGMTIATKANARVAWAAKDGLKKAFPLSFFSGAVMGLSVVGFALLGMALVLYIFKVPSVVLGFSFGASSLALLAKAGGGIFTKTADIGADLVGKVEFGLDEDDPRNPAVIADNVGDNVGDVAGMGADIFDSYVASMVAVMILGFELYQTDWRFTLTPLILGAIGIIASLLGMIFVQMGKERDPGKALNFGTIATTIIFAFLSFFALKLLNINSFWGIFGPTMAGLLAGSILGFTSNYYTDIAGQAVQETANSAKSGTAILILNGFSYGLFSVVPSIIGICLAMMAAWFIAVHFGIAGTYGVSLAAVGMLSVTGMIVSADAYGPIVDNAKGCSEAGKESDKTIAVCDKLDAAGNTAKAITKGFAIGAAALTVLALFAAYIETVNLKSLDLTQPEVVVGLFLGAMMPPLFSALTILSVGKNAFLMVKEIRYQLEKKPGILTGKEKPNSNRCIEIATKGALKELVLPGICAFAAPLIIGFLLGPRALGGFLGGAIISGIVFALFMANSGGLWDNAKKYIEDGALGGKGSEAHKAAVIGDTVGDPFKDTAGPSINTLITVMSLSATVFGSLIVRYALWGR